MAATGAALVYQEDVLSRRIEKGSMKSLRSASRTAVQEHDRPAAFQADLLDIDPVAVADVEHAGIEGTERFRQGLHAS